MTFGEFAGKIFYSQYIFSVPIPETTEFNGKTIIVTGSNTGLGREAVRHFVRLGAAKVIIACRTVAKGEAAKADIASSHSEAEEIVEVWELDLGSYDSVKAFARKAQQLGRLDALVENAGIAASEFMIQEEDESTITTNVVSTYLLALLMLPKLRETAEKYATKPHLTIVSSDMHYLAGFPEHKEDEIFKALSDAKIADMNNRYSLSKLLEVLISRELVKRYMPTGYPVITNLINPGFCHSDLARESGVGLRVLKFVFNARTTECGSRTLVHAAQAGPDSHGQFLTNCTVTQPSAFVLSDEGTKAQARVWKELSEKLERIQPGILENF